VNLTTELRVALIPLRRRVSFLLGGAFSSILRGDSEIKCLLEEVVDGLDDDDPFFFGEKTCSFLSHGCCTLSHKYISGVFNR
jgi:hypothetical protein